MTPETVQGNLLLKQDRNKHQCRRLLLQRLRYHITSEDGSTSNQVSTTEGLVKFWKKMIRLLRHDLSVLREEDGAVEFNILAPMFRSEISSSQYWSIGTWLKNLQKGGGPKKRFQCCVDPYSADTNLYFRAIQGHSGGKHINPTLQDNYHVGSYHDQTRSFNQD